MLGLVHQSGCDSTCLRELSPFILVGQSEVWCVVWSILLVTEVVSKNMLNPFFLHLIHRAWISESNMAETCTRSISGLRPVKWRREGGCYSKYLDSALVQEQSVSYQRDDVMMLIKGSAIISFLYPATAITKAQYLNFILVDKCILSDGIYNVSYLLKFLFCLRFYLTFMVLVKNSVVHEF